MSSEKHDMARQRNDIDRPDGASGAAAIKLHSKVRRLEPPLRCVWTNHPRHDCRCREQVPVRVVCGAWQRALQRNGRCAGFFDFSWQGQLWLGYGLPDGAVRGVYCPEHRAEREQRLGYDPQLVVHSEPVLTAAAAKQAG